MSHVVSVIISDFIVEIYFQLCMHNISDIWPLWMTFFNSFPQVLEEALRNDVDKNTKKGLTRVIVTRADTDMKQIKEEYQNQYGVSLSSKIEKTANGNYKDFLLTLVART